MHLSVLSDAFLSDSLDDSSWPFVVDRSRVHGRTHRDGLLRGLAFVAVVAAIVGLVTVAGLLETKVLDGYGPYRAGVPAIGPDRR